MKRRYWVLIVVALVLVLALGIWFFDGIQKSNTDSLQAWTKLRLQLLKSYDLQSQAYPSGTDSKIGISNVTVFLSILDSSQHRLLFFTSDGGSMLLWFPYEGLVFYHYVHGEDIGAV